MKEYKGDMRNLVVKKQKVKFEVYKATDSDDYPVNIVGLLQQSSSLRNDQKEVKLYGVTVRLKS